MKMEEEEEEEEEETVHVYLKSQELIQRLILKFEENKPSSSLECSGGQVRTHLSF